MKKILKFLYNEKIFYRVILSFIALITSCAGIFILPLILNSRRQITGDILMAFIIGGAVLGILMLSAVFRTKVNLKKDKRFLPAFRRMALTYAGIAAIMIAVSLLAGCVGLITYLIAGSRMDFYAIKNIIGVLAGILVVAVSPFLISIFFSESYSSDKFSKAFFDGVRLNIKRYFKLLGLGGSFYVAGFLLSKIFMNMDTVIGFKILQVFVYAFIGGVLYIFSDIICRSEIDKDSFIKNHKKNREHNYKNNLAACAEYNKALLMSKRSKVSHNKILDGIKPFRKIYLIFSVGILSFMMLTVTAPLSAFAEESGYRRVDFSEPEKQTEVSKEAVVPDEKSETDIEEQEVVLKEPENYYEDNEKPEGKLVEVTDTYRTYQTGPKSFVTEIGVDTGTFEENGKIYETNDDLVEKSTSSDDKYYENTANDYNVILPAKIDTQNGVKLSKADKQIELIPTDGDFSNAVTKGNAILYNNVFKDIDYQYTVVGDTIKEDIILNRPVKKSEVISESLDPKKSDDIFNEFSFRLETNGLKAQVDKEVISVFEKDINDPIFIISAPQMTDARGEVSTAIKLSLTEENGDYTVHLEADQKWLFDPERAYPVRIDPSTVVVTNGDIGLFCVEQGSPDRVIGDNNYPYSGYDDGIVSGNLETDGAAHWMTRTYVKVNYDFTKISKEARIDSATFSVYHYTKWSKGGTNFGLYKVDRDWDAGMLSWNYQRDFPHTFIGFHRSNVGPGWVNWDVRETMIDWIQNPGNNKGFCIKAEDERNMQAEVFDNKNGVNKPKLTIEWSIPDPVDVNMDLNSIDIKLRPITEKDVKGKLQFDAVFADGTSTPESYVKYWLTPDNTEGYAQASASYKYPNSTAFESTFPKGTKYHDKQSNWQTYLYGNLAFDKTYSVKATAAKGGKQSKEIESDKFLIYKVKGLDTFPYIANHYGVPLNTIMRDNRVQDSLVVENNTIFIRNPKTAKAYTSATKDTTAKKRIDSALMGRGLHCEYGFEPINLNTGNFWLESTDSSLTDLGGDFGITRSYNSKGVENNSVFGRGWSFGYQQTLSRHADGSVAYTYGDGKVLYFTPDGKGGYKSPSGYHLSLTERPYEVDDKYERDENGNAKKTTLYTYEIRETDGGVKKFNAWGLLTELIDENGYKTTIEYDDNFCIKKITGATGKSYTFKTDAFGRISKITTPDGNSLEYSYDGDSNLTKYKDANGNIVRYVYDANSLMTEWYDQEGNRIIQNKYDKEGRVIQQTDANGGVSKLNYGAGKTTATDAEGNVTIYHIDGLMRTTRIEHPEGVTDEFVYDGDNNLIKDRDFTYTYDKRGNRLTQTRSDGAVRTITYNDKNKETSITDYDGSVTAIEYKNGNDAVKITHPDGSCEKYTYDSHHRPLTHTDENGNTEKYVYEGAVVTSYTDKNGNVYSFTYDAMNRLTSTRLPDGTVTKKTYNRAGKEISDTAADGGVTSYTLNKVGNIIRITEPEGGSANVEYDGLANILKATDAKGNSVSYTYDKNNNKKSVTNGNGSTTRYEYDGLGRVIKETAADGGVTSYEYDDHNNITVKTDAYGNKIISEYNKAIDMPVSVTDVLGRTTAYAYDALGNPTKVDNPDGSSYSYEYDSRSRVTKFIDKTGITTELEYDGIGNMLKLTENGERVYTYEYDKNGNLIKTKDPIGGTEDFSFDSLNREIKEVNAGGQETSKSYDAAGRLNKITDALGGVVSASYDKNGNVISVTDAKGGKTSYLYDATGNLVSETNALGAITNFAYDGESQLTEVTDALNGVKNYNYDSVGNLSGVTDELGNKYSLSYDLKGNNTSITLPNGDKSTTEYDAAGRAVKTIDAAGLTTEYEYDNGDRLIREKDNGGADNTYEYDVFGNLIKKTNVLGEQELYEYDSFGQVTAITETDGNRSEFSYDRLGRLVSYTDPEGNVSTFTYDALGNLTVREESDGGVYKYAYDKLNRIIKETDPLGGESEYSYDANGNLIKAADANGIETSYAYDLLDQLTQETDGNGGKSTIEYDALGRLSKVTDPEGGDLEYRYDAAGNMTKLKDRNGHVTEYIYDSIGNVIKEISPKGAETEYEYDKHDVVTKIKDALGHETRYETDINGMTTKIIQANGGEYTYSYDAIQRLTDLTTPNGYKKTFTYDKRGDIISEKDNLDRESKYTYDVMHRVKEITDPKGSKTAFDYDKSGNILSVLEANGARSSFTYDLLDRVTEKTDAEGKKTSYEYDKAGNIIKIVKPGKRTTQFEYDNNYNLTQITDPLGEKVNAVYDKNDRVVETKDELGNIYKYTYDKEDQVTSVIDPTGEKSTFEYDAHGNISSIGNQLGAKQKFTYDLNDNLTKVTDALGRQTQYEYDVMDNLTKITDAAGKESSFTYDLEGNMLSFADASGKTDKLTYDLAGNLKSRTRPDGKKVSYDYDKLNNLTQKEYSENASKVLYLYDEMGNRTQMTDANGDSTYTYDLMNRITSVTSSDGRTVKYVYDEADNLASITYPDGRVISYEYDLNDRLIKVTDGELVTTYTYDAAGRVTETIRPNGSKSVYEYNEKDEIVRLENRSNDDKVESSFKYEYDATGNIVKEEAKNDTDSAVRTYEYNEADELTGFTEKSAETNVEYRYEYNDTGDRTSLEIKGKIKDEDVSEIIKYEYEEGLLIKETSSRRGDIQYEYDGNGNLVKKTGADNDVSYEYTVENRLKAVKSGGELLMAAGYDGDGNRIFQVTRNARDFKATNPLEEESVAEQIKSPNTGDNNWYLEAFVYGVWQGTANNLAAFNSSLAVKYTEDLRDEWDDIYHGRTYDKEAGEIDFSKEDMSLLKNAGLSDEDIDTITAQEIDDKKLEDEITIPGATYDVSEKYYDLTRYVNDVNTENTEVLQEYTQSGSLKSSHVYGNERIYSDVYDPASDAFNVSTYNYDGRRSVVQTVSDTGIESQLSYDPFGNLLTGETVGASNYGFNAEESNALTGLQYLRARYYDTSGGRFITADDYLGNIQQPLTLNRYAYTANNPVKYNDPNGHLFGWVKNAVKNVGNTFKKVGSAIAAGAKKVVSAVKNGIKKAYTSVKSFAKKAVGTVKNVFSSIGNKIAGVFKSATKTVKNVYSSARQTAVTYAGKAVSGVKNFASSAKQKAKSILPQISKSFTALNGAKANIFISTVALIGLQSAEKKKREYYCGNTSKVSTYNDSDTPAKLNKKNKLFSISAAEYEYAKNGDHYSTDTDISIGYVGVDYVANSISAGVYDYDYNTLGGTKTNRGGIYGEYGVSANASVVHADNRTLINTAIGDVLLEGTGDILHAQAGAKGVFGVDYHGNPELYVEGGAMASVASGEISGSIDFFGVSIGGKLEGHALAAGAEGKFGLVYDEETKKHTLTVRAGIAALFGGSGEITVSW